MMRSLVFFAALAVVSMGLLPPRSADAETATCDNKCRERRFIWHQITNRLTLFSSHTCEFCVCDDCDCLPTSGDHNPNGTCGPPPLPVWLKADVYEDYQTLCATLNKKRVEGQEAANMVCAPNATPYNKQNQTCPMVPAGGGNNGD